MMEIGELAFNSKIQDIAKEPNIAHHMTVLAFTHTKYMSNWGLVFF